MIRNSVVLPQPEGPRKHTSSPGWMARSIFCSATKLPKALWMPSICNASGAFVMRRTASLLRGRLALVTLGPLGEDLVAVLRRPVEVVLDQQRAVVRRDVGQRLRQRRHGDDREIL